MRISTNKMSWWKPILFLFMLIEGNIGQSQKLFKFKNRFNILDSSVCGVIYNYLGDNSLAKQMQSVAKDKYFRADDCGFFTISSANRKESLEATVTPGNSCCQIFKVTFSPKKSNSILKTNCEGFITENGIRLGMSSYEFFHIYPPDLFEVIFFGDSYILRFKGGLVETENEIYFDYISLYKFTANKLDAFVFGKYNDHYDYIKAIMNGNSLYKKFNEVYTDNWWVKRRSKDR